MGCNVGKKLRSWSSSYCTITKAAKEIHPFLCNPDKRPYTFFANEVKRIVSKGVPSAEEFNNSNCSCINQVNFKGTCVFDACVTVTKQGWTISINVS